MSKIIKAHQVPAAMAAPIFINNDISPKETQSVACQVAINECFDDEVFTSLSADKLAGNGEVLISKNPPAERADSLEEQGKAAAEQLVTTAFSQETKKGKALAAIEALKTKELELEAFKIELKGWEDQLRQKEKELSEKERENAEALIKRRQDVEQEASSTLKLAKEAANSTIEAANLEAEAIRKTVRAEEAAIREKAYNDGHREGYSVGEAKGISAGEETASKEIKFDWQNLMQETEMLIKELQTSRMGILKSTEEEMLKLVFAFAKTVLKTEPIVQPEIILNNLEIAINKVSEVDKIVMRINIRDKAMCEAHKDKFMARLGSVTELVIIEDSNLAPGGIKIETGVGTIDATIEGQARELEKAILDKYNKSQQEL
jgi:flagellar assembly protein FliH